MTEKHNPFQERWQAELSARDSGQPNSFSPTRIKFEKEQRKVLRSLLEIGSEEKILEFGCGKARILNELCSVTELCTGLDISREVLQLNRLNNNNLPFIEGDMFKQPFMREAFDVVLSEGVIEHFDNWPDILGEAVRVLKPRGQLLTAVPNLLNFPQTIALVLQGKRFRYYPEKPFFPGNSGKLAREYRKLGLTDLKFAGWRPTYFLESFYLFDFETGEVKQPLYSSALKSLGKIILNGINLLTPQQQKAVNRWFGYEFIISGIKNA